MRVAFADMHVPFDVRGEFVEQRLELPGGEVAGESGASPFWRALRSAAMYLPANSLRTTWNGNRYPLVDRLSTAFLFQPPPVISTCRWGWRLRFLPQVCRQAIMPEQGAQVFFVAEQFLEGVDGGMKQEVGHQCVVVPPQVVQLVRQGEDGVIVVAVEQLGLDLLQPALGGQGGALGAGGVFAGVVPDLLHVAVGAALDVSAERFGAAPHDGRGPP